MHLDHDGQQPAPATVVVNNPPNVVVNNPPATVVVNNPPNVVVNTRPSDRGRDLEVTPIFWLERDGHAPLVDPDQPLLGPKHAAVDHEPGLGEKVRELAAGGDGVQMAADGGERLLLRVVGRAPGRLDPELRADGEEDARPSGRSRP